MLKDQIKNLISNYLNLISNNLFIVSEKELGFYLFLVENHGLINSDFKSILEEKQKEIKSSFSFIHSSNIKVDKLIYLYVIYQKTKFKIQNDEASKIKLEEQLKNHSKNKWKLIWNEKSEVVGEIKFYLDSRIKKEAN